MNDVIEKTEELKGVLVEYNKLLDEENSLLRQLIKAYKEDIERVAKILNRP